MTKKQVLILCTGNSCRSQMAEGLARALFGDRINVYSAGSQPSIVNPNAIAVMAEIGIDISGHRSKHVDEFKGQAMDLVITVCDNAQASCPVFLGATTKVHWPFQDPVDHEISVYREVRDQIKRRFKDDLGGLL